MATAGWRPAPWANDERDPFLSSRRGGTELYLIRHADALPDAAEVSKGDYNAQALSATGRLQVEALAERLRSLAVDAIYSSPIARALQTAVPIAGTHGLVVALDPDLREVELGPVGPPPPADATAAERSELLRERLHDIAYRAITTGLWSSIPGSEATTALRSRVTASFGRIAARHPGSRVVVVSHGGAINAYIAAMLGITRDYFFPCANTSISVIRVKGERRLLMSLNDVTHLR